MRTVNLLATLLRRSGSFHWKQAKKHILSEGSSLNRTPLQCNTDGTRQTVLNLFQREKRKAEMGYKTRPIVEQSRKEFLSAHSFLAASKKRRWPMDDKIPITWLISHPSLLSSLPPLLFLMKYLQLRLDITSGQAGEYILYLPFLFHQQEHEQNIWTFCTPVGFALHKHLTLSFWRVWWCWIATFRINLATAVFLNAKKLPSWHLFPSASR